MSAKWALFASLLPLSLSPQSTNATSYLQGYDNTPPPSLLSPSTALKWGEGVVTRLFFLPHLLSFLPHERGKRRKGKGKLIPGENLPDDLFLKLLFFSQRRPGLMNGIPVRKTYSSVRPPEKIISSQTQKNPPPLSSS